MEAVSTSRYRQRTVCTAAGPAGWLQFATSPRQSALKKRSALPASDTGCCLKGICQEFAARRSTEEFWIATNPSHEFSATKPERKFSPPERLGCTENQSTGTLSSRSCESM